MFTGFLNKYSFHKEGHLTIGLSVLLTLVLFAFSSILGMLGAFCTLLVFYFFRDPLRLIPLEENIILSPADGVICKIENARPPLTMGLEEEMIKVSIFLSPLNVHVNRIPINAKVKKLYYTLGKCLRADYDNSEHENERQEILLETQIQNEIKNLVLIQQTGFLTRRIVCNLNHDEEVKAGKRFGIIKFGSRVTLYLPKDIYLFVDKGQTVIAGETILASFKEILTPIKTHLLD